MIARAMAEADATLVARMTSASIGSGTVPGAASRPRAPDGWRDVTVCAEEGPASAYLPARVDLDGPRPLRNIDLPATGTFAWGYSTDRSIRYDLFAVVDADEYGSSDRAIATAVLRQLNGEPHAVEMHDIDERDGHVVGTYDERFDGRDYRMHFVSAGGSVVALGVGVYLGSSRDTVEQAKADLEEMWGSLSVAGIDGVSKGTCTGPSDEPG